MSLRRYFLLLDRHDITPRGETVDQICPVLHHDLSLRKIFGTVVAAEGCVFFLMRQLSLDDIRPVSQFVEHRAASRGPEAVGRKPSRVSHALEHSIECGARHVSLGSPNVRVQSMIATGQFLELAQEFQRLAGE
jgi:hypothetical protein